MLHRNQNPVAYRLHRSLPSAVSRRPPGLGSRTGRKEMAYLIGWLLGVPLIVLVILYLVFH
ncbi:conserved hypothetical protein [Paraburkholderia piptadeniae]|uniref:Uncharacterized protein n=1 Tax=Paraburkholderia piptadeniae TaxID=1701573 RepID=A0A1N7RNY0_9BURK|nr:conserved hypothetical protein [Paraburkholderia piptadeniae]